MANAFGYFGRNQSNELAVSIYVIAVRLRQKETGVFD